MGRLKIGKTCQQETNIRRPNDGPAKRISGKGAAANIEVPPNKKDTIDVQVTGSVQRRKEERPRQGMRLQAVHHDELTVIDLPRDSSHFVVSASASNNARKSKSYFPFSSILRSTSFKAFGA